MINSSRSVNECPGSKDTSRGGREFYSLKLFLNLCKASVQKLLLAYSYESSVSDEEGCYFKTFDENYIVS